MYICVCVHMIGGYYICMCAVAYDRRHVSRMSKKSEQTLRWHGQHHRCPQENKSLVPRMEEYISEWSGGKNYGEIVDAVDGFANITVRSRC